ncbi:RNA polymerase sigma-70 factor [Zhouia spongiae]|uniref:RNA polymerase sigma-70 factor n=1 Tax=Zhouia spongiae TaxID=2202721 RepID=A0ABY3YLT8_9FLAO|nr:RNA polymerase sigma-70 factor [Zhouia spongiae]UNY98578.1 RNA polymerase sigma-70 factor [Zhouia spongiae]
MTDAFYMNFRENNILINGIKSGNKEAYIFMAERYHHKLCVYANSLVNNPMQAEDIVQNVFINVWIKREKLNPDYSLKTFLYKSVYNEFIDQFRRGQVMSKIEQLFVESLNNVISDQENDNTEKMIKLVRSAIDELPAKCKNIFELSKKEGLTNIEIAEYLGVSVKLVEKQITKGYKSIKEYVASRSKVVLIIINHMKMKVGNNVLTR